MRQYVVTHRETGIETVVNIKDGREQADNVSAALAAGHYRTECDVERVPRGQEIPLPFDTLPLVMRRNGHA